MITGVVLARNEAHNIVECLRSLRRWVDEAILIDMESEDDTVALARPLVDKVLRHERTAFFDAARNLAIDAAAHDWLWFLDADERVPEVTGKTVRRLVRDHGDQFEAISIPFRTHFCGKWMRYCGWWGYTCPRVLKRGQFQFSRQLHGGVELRGREARLPRDPQGGILHYSYRDLQHYIDKSNRYTSTEAMHLAERGITYDWRRAVRSFAHDLWEHYELHDAKRDGDRGWILCWLASQYRWLSHAKLLDLQMNREAYGGLSSVPASLDEVLAEIEDELAYWRTRTPRLPLDLVLRLADARCSEARSWVRLLSDGSRKLHLIENATSDHQPLPKIDTALWNALGRTRRPGHAMAITLGDGHIPQVDENAVLNVLRPVGDLPELNESDTQALEQYDELWIVIV